MLKHIGRTGDRKVAIVFREIPNEKHMCLVIYPDTLHAHWQDSIQKALESDVAQQVMGLPQVMGRKKSIVTAALLAVLGIVDVVVANTFL